MIETTPDSATDSRSGAGRACAVKLPAFEGPLDLLLHLIRANEVDIADIPIAVISEQYLEYLDLMRQLDIDIAADYLLMAATLAHIKSRMLLPPAPGDEADELGTDPRAELARRLAEYAVFKEVALELDQRPLLGRDVFAALAEAGGLPESAPPLHASLFALVESMRRVLESLPAEQRHHEVTLERVTLQERMIAVMDRLRDSTDSLLFEDLVGDVQLSRHNIVVTFLAILELAKIQALRLFQNVSAQGLPSGPVRVRIAVEGVPDAERIAAAGEQAEREWELENEQARERVAGGASDVELGDDDVEPGDDR